MLVTSTIDIGNVVNHGTSVKSNIPVTNIYDFNKDGLVNMIDLGDAINHGTSIKSGLVLISIAGNGPFAPVVVTSQATGGNLIASSGVTGDALVASALASTSSNQLPAIPPWIISRLSQLDLSHGSIAKYLTHLAHDATAEAKSILVEAVGLRVH